MSLFAFDFRDQLYADWEHARGPLIEQLDLLYAALNAQVVTKDPTTGLVTGIGGDIYNNTAASQVQVNLSTNTTGILPVASGGTGGSSGISVATAGALTGNGTSASPLSVLVDGSTISKNGSNQLTATTSVFVQAVGFIHTSALSDTFALNDIFVANAITGIANKIIVPLWMFTRTAQTNSAAGAYNTSAQVKLCYNGLTTSIITPGNRIVNTADFANTTATINTTNLSDLTSSSAFLGLGLDIRANGPAFCGTNFPTLSNTATIAYVVM